jgi:dienelactone hydrolase
MNGIEVDIFFPDANSCSDGASAPFSLIVFAHGFSMFGAADGPAENQGNGEHLASWGYVVAIPNLPDDAEERITMVINAMDYLESANQDPGSSLYQKIDVSLMGAAGYSLGGATALAVTARDFRVKVVVALDPVYHEGNMSGEGIAVWDPVAEAPNILVPSGILGAPADSCNAEADYQDIYPLIGTNLKATYHIVGASHCIFADPGNAFCSVTCGGTNESYMTELSQKYMTAWLNYHLQGKSEYYSYLYGFYAEQDIDAGLIVRQVDTFPDENEPPVDRGRSTDGDFYEHFNGCIQFKLLGIW